MLLKLSVILKKKDSPLQIATQYKQNILPVNKDLWPQPVSQNQTSTSDSAEGEDRLINIPVKFTHLINIPL